MPYGAFINTLPPAFSGGALDWVSAWRVFRLSRVRGTASLMGWAFSLYALAELVYMTYHLDWTVFLFAHTISEVLDLVAIVLLFVAATQGAAHARRGWAPVR